jgi:hypothetical protein
MIETFGKIPQQQPIKCGGCEGDQMYRYFPHIGERVKANHNVQEVDTIEYMGRSILRIYETLDKKKA